MQRRHNAVSSSTVLLVLANLLMPVAILVFATGFFPYKPFLPGLAVYEALDYGTPPDAPFDRLVFMVVDALRSDFVFLEGSGFQYTQQLIANGAAIPFTAHATSPTITMPRIKAMTTGSIPSFLDVILNFDEGDKSSTLASQDTWLAQMRAKEAGKLVMYGDDTWLKLFPDTFDRADGTSSFFVSDFTEVDNNVTRHVAGELQNDDWNTMVLHYLGLDHIGHKSGPRSPNMRPKQIEMDNIVRQVYEAMESRPHLQSALFVLCGDHGMNDAGNHGASSAGETSPALVFISPKLASIARTAKAPAALVEDFQYYNVVEQSDLAPTLAALLGFPVPKNNLGAMIVDFLPLWPQSRDQMQILVRNARQILTVVTATFGNSNFEAGSETCSHAASDDEELACEWQLLNSLATSHGSGSAVSADWISRLSAWLHKAQRLMSSMASNYDVQRLAVGEFIIATALVCVVLGMKVSLDLSITAFTPLLLLATSYCVMMFASSYVEEEHHFWYWATSAWFAWLALRRRHSSATKPAMLSLAAVLSLRLIRSWNQTGQKHTGEADIVKLVMIRHPALLWGLVIATYAMVLVGLVQSSTVLPAVVNVPLSCALVLAAFSFKLAFTEADAPELVVGLAKGLMEFNPAVSLVRSARLVFYGLFFALSCPLYTLMSRRAVESTTEAPLLAMRNLFHLYTLLALTQSRATNVPLFILFRIAYVMADHLALDAIEITTTSILLQFASFFAMGGSNAISSVDLSSAYNGIGGFNVVAVGVLIFISNWAGPVWWSFAASLLLAQSRDEGGCSVYKQHVSILTLFALTSLASVMAACTALRTHLFIWTVFSPKYLYSMAWSLGQHLAINVGFGGVLYRLGSGAKARVPRQAA